MTIQKTLLAFSVLFIVASGYSQKIDSLKALLKTKTGLERADVLYELGYEIILVDSVGALAYGLEGFTISKNFNDSLRTVKAGLIIGSALRRLQQIDSAIRIYEYILPLCPKKNSEERMMALNSYGISLALKAQYDKALTFHFESLAIRSVLRDTALIVVSKINIAFIYYKLKDYKKALRYYFDAYEMSKQIGAGQEDRLQIFIGLCYVYLGHFKEAERYVKNGLLTCGNNCSLQSLIQANFAYGVIQFGLKNYRKSEPYFKKSYVAAKSLNDIRLQLDNIDYLSQIYILENKLSAARLWLNRAETLIRTNESYKLENIKIYAQFSELFTKSKKFQLASRYQRKYIQLKDSVFSEQLTLSLMKTEADFLARENAAKVEAQNQIISLKEEIIKRQSLLNIVSIVLGLTTVVILLQVLRHYRQKKMLNVLLDKRIEERTQQLKEGQDEFVKSFKERDLQINRVSVEMTEALNTIKGLCSIGIKDVADPAARSYIIKINTTSNRLADHVKSLC